ncbi:hypothetical protein [Pontibacter sp. G13]|uniref:hypothetical protein n=1 Tax=Pontibacter sp. G13 TaxID=3074898 RepID=UPI00288B430E|nr:hypothetical protein [Pontibacter sp. G13]WNJ18756.1 hypothetical protein RJD25_28200 [Pontibacter sp. G13]
MNWKLIALTISLFALLGGIPLPIGELEPIANASPDAFEAQMKAVCIRAVQDSTIYHDGWDQLNQPTFWRTAMKYGPDTVIVNIAKNREIIGYLSTKEWERKTKRQKKRYEDQLREQYGLAKRDEIYFTTGRKHFYQIEKVVPELTHAVDIFLAEGTDPWYAQAILLIESPGRLQFSTSGAYGSFQLMAAVARDMGLVVNDSIDERKQFDKSAMGAARLLQRICIPKTKRLCERYGLEYDERDLWFRLLVMHVYHAGIGNVSRVMRKIRPRQGGIELFEELWQTKGRRFGNASQNYSQIALASLMELEDRLAKKGIVCPIDNAEITLQLSM